jgi:benzoyl-CoA reductase/2-hydroxyglutaryl-CoA dehydratase subunit BcrC/BadD/HgdB
MPKAEHLAILEAVTTAPREDALRVMIAGSPQDHGMLHSMVEELGAQVAADAHAWGDDLVGPPFTPELGPFDLIADRYHLTPPSYTMPIAKEASRCAELATTAKADAVVFYVHRHDDLQRFTTPDEIDAVKALGLPVLYLAEQSYKPGEAVRAELSAFLRQIPPMQRVGGAS